MRGTHIEHFARQVSARRKGLGLTFVDVNQNGGPTAPTVAKAEAGELADPRPSTLSKFDVGLRWVPGSAARAYWDGDEPRPREAVAESRALALGSATVSLRLDTVLALMNTLSQLNDHVEGNSWRALPKGLRAVVDDLNQQVGAVVGLFVTDLLEHNHAIGDESNHPMIEYALSEPLSPQVSEHDPDRDEKLYRRWLMGKSSGITPDLEALFHDRLGCSPTHEGT